jgi:hypothetical protein
MKKYERIEIQLMGSLISALDGGEGQLHPPTRPPHPIGNWVETRDVLATVEKYL